MKQKTSEKKCVLDDCRTIAQEEKILATKAQLSKIKNDEYEKNHNYERIPIMNGYRMRRID